MATVLSRRNDDQLQRDRAAIAISAGAIAASTALIGFGLDSVIEVSSAAIVAWQFSGPIPPLENGRRCE